jgi:hypothetical protein
MEWPLMTEEELHKFGVEAIHPYIEKEGVTIESVNTNLKMNPQIVGKRWGSVAHIAVRTASYPKKGSLTSAEAERIIAWADRQGATAFFAGVGVLCSSYPDKSPVCDENHHSLPIRHGGFIIDYEGLLVLTMSDRVRVWEDED